MPTLRISDETHARLQVLALLEEVTLVEAVARAVEQRERRVRAEQADRAFEAALSEVTEEDAAEQRQLAEAGARVWANRLDEAGLEW